MFHLTGASMSESNFSRRNECPDCDNVSRRGFLRTTTAAAVAAVAVVNRGGTWVRGAEASVPAAAGAATSETLVAQLYKTFKEEQRKAICFPFDHPLRSDVDNNWFIVKDKRVKSFFDKDQQAMIRDIFMSMHSEEYAPKVLEQVEHDNKDIGGLGGCSIAMFGEPGTPGDGSKFEFVLTGRHTTRRCDGNSVAGAAFGGPIFYGHAAESFNEKPDHKGNVYWFQGLRANEVYKALDGKQRKLALLDINPPGEHAKETVELPIKSADLEGIPMTELSKDQQGLVRKVLADLLAPFRKADADEALKLIEAGGFDNLHMAFLSTMEYV
jgi:hypothetical protein